MITVYGIPNCDTVKKARTWLADRGVEAAFHDFKKQGVPAAELPAWLKAFGRDKLLNRAGTTWRKLDDATKAGVVDDASATALMLAEPSVIKRPVVRWADGRLTLGFSAPAFEEGASAAPK
ncbi:arsenate reductase [Roseateles asaccharophilus]|uniref:Spx/MgsR family transcriptional regulator n=1 Tax=Roseateles asaccharophilus TaxID=582607 RepID=A0ABU2AAK5_9BURK|nr:arsenate reductase [Roseateles asaccharophilus]MDR7334150.1 Spx/MgsR family transcriptional regulator [Roseateles asaccharophilus]